MKILILQYLQPGIDKLAIPENETRYFTGLMARLSEYDIRFRLHPESKAKPVYRALYAGVRFDDENRPFRYSLDWPDLVIGPAWSGAMLESIASGKRTFMVLLPPHSCTMRYFRGAVIHETVEAVHNAVRSGLNPDHSAFLERYTARKESPDPVGAIWRALVA